MSFGTAITGTHCICSEKFFRFEDFFWGFAFAGVVSVAYEVVFFKCAQVAPRHNVWKVGGELLKLLALIVAHLIILTNVLHLNSIYSISISLVVTLLYMYSKRADLLRNMLWSGLLSFVFIFIFYFTWQYPYPEVFYRFWKMDAISGVLFFGIPIEELVWFFLAGAFIGPLYEFVTGAETVSRKVT
ncbi:MAG: hypothetical protein UX89_C0005G0032 [Parcubacteria group bacterium GW2011_GWA2_47_16]|nr:MAG: hypothetical protein UX89_C0005G0032 [Parcubacteria group bacterium GW2011_GWA2_47_16]